MFERFTERARQVVVLAEDEARQLRNDFIGTEHLLLGLLRENEGLAARVLEYLGVTADETRTQIKRVVDTGVGSDASQLPFTPRAKKVLELALREALSLGHNYIGTEHILLGLVREGEGLAMNILRDFDVSGEKIREEILKLLKPRDPHKWAQELALDVHDQSVARVQTRVETNVLNVVCVKINDVAFFFLADGSRLEKV